MLSSFGSDAMFPNSIAMMLMLEDAKCLSDVERALGRILIMQCEVNSGFERMRC
jgi:hypothetical protein